MRKNVVDVFVRAVEDVKDKKQSDQELLLDYLADMVDILVKSTHDYDLKVAISAIKVVTSLVQYDKLNADQKNYSKRL